MSSIEKVDCGNCVHFRAAPYEARLEGCYLPGNMPSKQTARYLDEQQQPGDHEKINRDGDCPDFHARRSKPSLWRRILSLGA